MRQKFDPQSYLGWTSPTGRKIIRQYREKYKHISETLDNNLPILDVVDQALKKLSQGGEDGRKAQYTSENILRALIVHQIEGTSLRETMIRIAESETLRNFVRLGSREVMDYSFLDKCFNAIGPETWKSINDILSAYASDNKLIALSTIRTDTTVVEANIHYPTDSSLLWDSHRVLCRLLRTARKRAPELLENRFHDKKVRKLHLFITRYAASSGKQRKREVKRGFRKLLGHVGRIVGIAGEFCSAAAGEIDVKLMAIAAQIEGFLPAASKVVDVVSRVVIDGEKVPAAQRVFSIFEQHVELIKRGKRNKPVEFGHKMILTETKEKFIADYDVLEKQISDSKLTEPVVDRHEGLFGLAPETLAADGGFWSGEEKMESLRERVKTLAVPKNVRDWANKILPKWQRFRAGIEGTISVLKRVFRLMRCLYRGFKNFASSIGLGIFSHNLVCLNSCSRK